MSHMDILPDTDDGDAEDSHSLQPARERRIKCPVHDYIIIDADLARVIDTPQFQRLRNIKQLGTSCHVWPGAAHNRFEHSLGVAHLCSKMVERLMMRQPELGITPRDKRCVVLAGLCHDLGHGPLSHVWDQQYMPKALAKNGIKTKWEHEEGSELMFDALVKENNIPISVEDANFIKDLIRGKPKLSKDRVPPEKSFLFQIVANRVNGIDVDKLDYIARDSWTIDDKKNNGPLRLINSARVLGKGDDLNICYNIKDAPTVYDLFHERFSLFKRIYTHKTSRAIEYMYVDALLAADPVMDITTRVFDASRFLGLTDFIVQEIKNSTDARLAEARAILARVDRRELYRVVDQRCVPWEIGSWADGITAADIVAAARVAARTSADAPLAASLREEHVIVDLHAVHWGMRAQNPIDAVLFYGRYGSQDTAFTAEPADVTHLLPSQFGEHILRIFTRDSQYLSVIQAGFRLLLRQLEAEAQVTPRARALTPVSREGTSAPPGISPAGSAASLSATPCATGSAFMTVPPGVDPYSSPKARPRKRVAEAGADGEDARGARRSRR